MLLRVSSQEVDLEAALSGDERADPRVPHGVSLRRFALAVHGGEPDELRWARGELIDLIGPQAVCDAACVAACFEALDRVADATGTRLDEATDAGARVMLAGLGLDELEQR